MLTMNNLPKTATLIRNNLSKTVTLTLDNLTKIATNHSVSFQDCIYYVKYGVDFTIGHGVSIVYAHKWERKTSLPSRVIGR